MLVPMAGRNTSVALEKLAPFQYCIVLVRWMLTVTLATPPPGSAEVPQMSSAGVPQPAVYDALLR